MAVGMVPYVMTACVLKRSFCPPKFLGWVSAMPSANCHPRLRPYSRHSRSRSERKVSISGHIHGQTRRFTEQHPRTHRVVIKLDQKDVDAPANVLHDEGESELLRQQAQTPRWASVGHMSLSITRVPMSAMMPMACGIDSSRLATQMSIASNVMSQ